MSLFLQMIPNDKDQVPIRAKSSAISKQYVYPNRYVQFDYQVSGLLL
jgi:hypothetical protein